MTKPVLTYAPSLVKVKLYGIPVEAFSPDSVADIERLEGDTRFRKTPDGSLMSIMEAYGTYRVSFQVFNTSPSNTWLHLLYKIFQKLGIDLIMPIEVEDKNGTGGTTLSAVDVYFESEPSTSFTAQGEVSTWSFICHNASYTKKGVVETYDLAEKLQHLVTMLTLAQSYGLNIDNIVDYSSQLLDSVSENILHKF